LVGGGEVCDAYGESLQLAQRATADCELFLKRFKRVLAHLHALRPDRDWQVQSMRMLCGPRDSGTGSSPREGAGDVVGARSREGWV
jgi:hypothetical protein